jgi:signal transduction histidine kinase
VAYWQKVNQCIDKIHSLKYNDLKGAELVYDSLYSSLKKPIDNSTLSNLYTSKANIEFDKGNYNSSLELNLKALKIREKLKDTLKIASSLGNIGNVYYYTEDTKKAIEYHKKAVNYKKKQPNSNINSNYNTIGLVFTHLFQYDSATYYYNKSLISLNTESKNYNYNRAKIFSNLSTILDLQGHSKKAVSFLDSAILINKKIGRENTLAWEYYKKAEILMNLGENEASLVNLRNAEEIANKASTIELKKNIKYGIFKHYLITNKVDSAIKYNNLYYKLNDSISFLKTDQNIQNAEAKYQVEKKEAALQLSKEKAQKLALENKAKNQLLLLAFSGIFILALVILYIYRNFKQKEKLDRLELEIKDSRLDELLSDQESKAYAAILQGQETERERIAQDLHDRLGGTLAALKLALRKPENNVAPDDLAIIDLAVNEVRSIAHNLSTGLVHKYGLNEAINQLFRTLEQSKGIKFSLFLHPKTPTLGQSAGIELYRIVQELVSNTIKHAQSSEVSLQTNFSDGIFNLIFEDNGIGFDQSEKKGGIGLENIRNRVNRLGGELHIDAEKGRGSIFIVEIKKNT